LDWKAQAFPKLDFAIQNCNSLNVSLNSEKQLKKIAAILTIGAGIVFLSDIRLNADPNSNKSTMFKNCNNRAYDFWHNSTKSKRGVGILISSDINTVLIRKYCDENNNILGLLVEIDNTRLLLVAVYGPNVNDNDFFTFLRKMFAENVGVPIVCGGDWNLTYSSDPSVNNIDIINMVSPPSSLRSGKVLELCENFHLTDPYRILYPTRRDYTYVPRAQTNKQVTY
jgi:exonuclease III